MSNKFLDQQGLSVLWGLIGNKYATEEEIENIICRGYYHNGIFYVSKEYREAFVAYSYKLYIDIETNYLYTYDGTQYIMIKYPLASKNAAGVMKLYDSFGLNEDGTISQKVITQELEKKIEMEQDGETLNLFTTTLI